MSVHHQYRSGGGEPRVVRSLDFDRLPPAVQDRLVRCLAEGGAPEPLLHIRVPGGPRIPGTPRFYTLLGVFAAAAEGALWFAHFGDLTSDFALQRGALVEAHVFSVALLCLAVLAHIGFRRTKSAGAPFPEGRFLFAQDLVETHGRLLTVTSLDTLRSLEAQGRGAFADVHLVFRDGTTIEMRAYGDDPVATVARVEAEIAAAAALVLPDDQPRLERIDPFFELRVARDWASAEADPGDGRRIPSFQWFVAASLLAGLLLGPALQWTRNRLSDDSMFAQVRDAAESGTDEEFEGRQVLYWRHGDRHRTKTDELRFARASKDIKSLARYIRDYPDGKSLIAPDDALFEMVKKAGTMEAYGVYLGTGCMRHAEEADDALFAEAKKLGTPDAFRQYLAGHGMRHEKDVKTALLPGAEIQAAQKDRAVVRLLDIAKQNGSGPFADAAIAAVHRIYQDLLLALQRGQGLDKMQARSLFEPLLSHADRVLDPYVRFSMNLDTPERVALSDAQFAREYGYAYLPAAAAFKPSVLERERSRMTEILKVALRAAFGEALVLDAAPWPGDRAMSYLDASLGTFTGREPFVSNDKRAVFCDVRLRLHLRSAAPVGGSSMMTLSTERTAFAADDLGTLQLLVRDLRGKDAHEKSVKDAYAKMVEGAPDELGGLFERALR